MTPFAIIAVLLLALSSLHRCDAFGPTLPIRDSLSTQRMEAATIRQITTALSMGGRTNKQRREDRKGQKSNQMIDFIGEPVTPQEMVGDVDSITANPEDDDLAEMVKCIVKAADGRKAENIVAMRVSKVSTVTSFVIIATGNSRPQNQAITAVIQDDIEEAFGLLPGSTGVPEGSADSGWTILDYGSVMVHVMTPKSRLFYNVEGKWKDEGGEYMDISDVILPNVVVEEPAAGSKMLGLSEEEDPFWS